MPKLPQEIKSVARRYTSACMEQLGGWATNEKTDDDIRIRAIGMLLDRGWGKPAQPHTGEDGEGGIELIIRKLFEEKKRDDNG